MTIREKLIEILKAPIFPHEQADPAEVVADYLLDNGVTIQRWIPVTERLPEHCATVISYNGTCVQKDFYDEGFECWYSELELIPIRITHWMPLPEPPKGV